MKIYFSGAISAGRQRQPVYARMVEFLTCAGMEVLSAHVARADVLHAEAHLSAREIFTRDMDFIAECRGMIAEVSLPSLGVGYEVATCLQLGRPVLCLCEQQVFLSRILTGNTDPNLRCRFYADEAQWQEAMADFCTQLRGGSFPAPLHPR